MASITAELKNNKPIVLILCITAIVFINSLFNSYALDDELYALNPAISEPSFGLFSQIFTSGTFHDKGIEGYDYRPLSLSSFLLEYLVFGKHVGLSHAINLLLYLLILVQFYKLLLKLGIDANLALMAMLLFALHPIHTEVINNLKCRDELLMFVFALSSFHFALNYFFDQRLVHLLYVFGFMFLSFLSKPTAVLFLVTFPLSILFCHGFNIKKLALITLSLVASYVVYTLIRHMAIDIEPRKVSFHENPFVTYTSPLLKFSTGIHVAYRYLKLLVIPEPLAFYYGYKYVDVAYFREPLTIFSIVVHLSLVIVFIKNFKTNKPLAFGVLFYLLNIFVISFFIKQVPGLMGERFVFSASLGFCIIMAFVLVKLKTYVFKNSKYNYLFILILVIYGVLSFKRNKVWKNKETLYSNDIKHLDRSAKANLLYGALLSDQAVRERNEEKLDKAILHVKKATEIVPNYSLAWETLGALYFFKSDLISALSYENIALLKDSTNAKAYFDKGCIFEAVNYYITAEKFFLRSLKHDPKFVPCYLKLMNLYVVKGQPEKALAIGETGATHEKKSDQVYTELIKLSLQTGDTLKAIGYMEKVAAVDPKKWSGTLQQYKALKR